MQAELDLASTHVLIVDDEASILDVTSRFIKRVGFQVITAKTGEAAMDAIREHKPTVVLTDKNLPRMSGLDVVRNGREIVADAQFIIMTGYASLDSSLEAMKLGVFAYIKKPFTRAELVDPVTAAANHVHKKREIQAMLERMREASSAKTSNIAVGDGLAELGNVVHMLERSIASLNGVLADPWGQWHEQAVAHVAELGALIKRLSVLKEEMLSG